jgi:F-type H+-transporting ATPase subunit epsilon
MAQLEVNLVSATQAVWSGAATMVVAPAADGEIGVLAGHVPVLSVLRAGEVRIRTVEGADVHADVDGGFLSVDSDVVTIVADSVTVATGAATR